MNKIENLNDLLMEQGRELYDAVQQEQDELSIIEKNAQSYELKNVIHNELEKSKGQRDLLKSTFDELHASPEGKRSQCCSSILRETHSFITRSKPDVRDAAIINGLQRLNHDKITGYGSLSAYLREIGEGDLANKFHDLVEEERNIDKTLTELANKTINRKAMHETA